MTAESIIVVMGVSGVGKSSFIKLATGRDDVKVGSGLQAETLEVREYTFQMGPQTFVLVDTPGFDDGHHFDSEILRCVAEWLESSYRAGAKLAAVLYLHRMTHVRMVGTNLQSLQMLQMLQILCGKDCYRNIFLGTTFWSAVDPWDGIAREHDLVTNENFWKPMDRDLVDDGIKFENLAAAKAVDKVAEEKGRLAAERLDEEKALQVKLERQEHQEAEKRRKAQDALLRLEEQEKAAAAAKAEAEKQKKAAEQHLEKRKAGEVERVQLEMENLRIKKEQELAKAKQTEDE